MLAGLGNVYKSEVLFACGVNPFVTVAGLDDDQLERLVDTGRKLLRANVGGTSTGLTTYTGSGARPAATTRPSNSGSTAVAGCPAAAAEPQSTSRNTEEMRG